MEGNIDRQVSLPLRQASTCLAESFGIEVAITPAEVHTCFAISLNDLSQEDCMKRIATLVAGITLLAISGLAAAAEDLASQLVGVWKYVSVSNTEVAAGKVTHPVGEKPIGYNVYTKGGRLIFSLVGDNRARPAGPVATDAERLRLYDTLATGSGTYKVDGNTLLSTFDSSWLETWTGTTQKRKIAITGNKLTITSDPFKNLAGQEVTFEIVLERVE